MASVSMNIRMDSDIKSKAQHLFSEFGLDMTTAINMFLRQSIRENGIPFKLNLDIPNKETLRQHRINSNKKKEEDKSPLKSYQPVENPQFFSIFANLN